MIASVIVGNGLTNVDSFHNSTNQNRVAAGFFYCPSNATRSAISHYDDGNPFRNNCGNADGDGGNDGSLQQIGCTNCHAGAARNYGAHSSTYGTPSNASKCTAQNTGFMNGNAWSAALDNNGCYPHLAHGVRVIEFIMINT